MIIFLGIAGSGKSVQCRLLARFLNCEYISVGELLRSYIDKDDQRKMIEGELLPDQTVISVVKDAKDEIINGEFIIDGFPRTYFQAHWIVGLGEVGKVRVVHLRIDQDESLRRLKARNRKDDNEQAIKKRFDEYEEFIEPVLREFSDNNIKVFNVDGSAEIEKVHQYITRVLLKDGVRKN